ncbi:hypothetical protein BGZ94_004014, partial [Podila epigama]
MSSHPFSPSPSNHSAPSAIPPFPHQDQVQDMCAMNDTSVIEPSSCRRLAPIMPPSPPSHVNNRRKRSFEDAIEMVRPLSGCCPSDAELPGWFESIKRRKIHHYPTRWTSSLAPSPYVKLLAIRDFWDVMMTRVDLSWLNLWKVCSVPSSRRSEKGSFQDMTGSLKAENELDFLQREEEEEEEAATDDVQRRHGKGHGETYMNPGQAHVNPSSPTDSVTDCVDFDDNDIKAMMEDKDGKDVSDDEERERACTASSSFGVNSPRRSNKVLLRYPNPGLFLKALWEEEETNRRRQQMIPDNVQKPMRSKILNAKPISRMVLTRSGSWMKSRASKSFLLGSDGNTSPHGVHNNNDSTNDAETMCSRKEEEECSESLSPTAPSRPRRTFMTDSTEPLEASTPTKQKEEVEGEECGGDSIERKTRASSEGNNDVVEEENKAGCGQDYEPDYRKKTAPSRPRTLSESSDLSEYKPWRDGTVTPSRGSIKTLSQMRHTRLDPWPAEKSKARDECTRILHRMREQLNVVINLQIHLRSMIKTAPTQMSLLLSIRHPGQVSIELLQALYGPQFMQTSAFRTIEQLLWGKHQDQPHSPHSHHVSEQMHSQERLSSNSQEYSSSSNHYEQQQQQDDHGCQRFTQQSYGGEYQCRSTAMRQHLLQDEDEEEE